MHKNRLSFTPVKRKDAKYIILYFHACDRIIKQTDDTKQGERKHSRHMNLSKWEIPALYAL